MAGRRILLIEGHPDPEPRHLLHRLADAYAEGALAAGHELRRLRVAAIEFPLLSSAEEFEHGAPPPAIAAAQAEMEWAEHWVILYPLWLGCMPARFKAFLEQALRPGFRALPDGRLRLSGRSAHVVLGMGMPALIYRWWYGAHGLKLLRRNILGFCGVRVRRETLVGAMGMQTPARAEAWCARLARDGRAGR